MNKIDKIIKESISKILYETTRRQKAQRSFLGKMDNVKTFCIITSENPMGHKLSPSENRILYNELISELQSQQYIYFPVRGKYNDTEHSLMIFNISLNSSLNIGLKYNQESFIYATVAPSETEGKNEATFSYYEKGVKGGYRKVEETKEYLIVNDRKDYFTAISRKFKFTIPFKYFNECCMKINNIIAERSSVNDIYKDNYKMWINESVSSSQTPKSQHLYRAKLWGKNYLMGMK